MSSPLSSSEPNSGNCTQITASQIFNRSGKDKSEMYADIQSILTDAEWLNRKDSMGFVFLLVKNGFHEEVRVQKFLRTNNIALLHVYIAHLRK